jgi:hypothetical protein
MILHSPRTWPDTQRDKNEVVADRPRRWFVRSALGAALMAATAPCWATGAFSVVLERDLQALGSLARKRQLPIMLIVSASDCSFCERLKQTIIEPMNRSGRYVDTVLIREWMIDASRPVRDFNGDTVTGQAVAMRYQASVTPTVLLLSPDGEELAKRLVGINNVDFYGWYLDQAIETARDELREKS